jgi:hypothetical protein
VLAHGDPAGVVNGGHKRRPARERVDVDSALVELNHEVVQAPKPSLAAVFVGGPEDLPQNLDDGSCERRLAGR